MPNGNNIKNLINQIAAAGRDGVITGTVKSISPLSITATNDPQFTLNANVVVVPDAYSDFEIEVDIPALAPAGDCSGTAAKSKATLKLYNALKVNDTVYLLSFNSGSGFIVIGRE